MIDCFLFFRYGITYSDVFCSISNNAAGAVLTGLIVSEERQAAFGRTQSHGKNHKYTVNTCTMHVQELCLKHALGIVVGKRKGDIYCSFEKGKSLRDRARALASCIMNKKIKGRFTDYNKMSLTLHKQPALKLALPNDTRVSGAFLLFTSLLRSKVCKH